MNKLIKLVLAIILTLVAIYFLEPGIVLFAILAIYIFYLWQTKSKDYKMLINAFLVSVIWILIAYKMYQYNERIALKFLGIPLFPLVAWIISLMAFYYLSKAVLELFPKYFDKKHKKIIFSIFFYSSLMIIFESIGYNILGIHLASNYPGLSICNCLHAPLWMQIGYFLNGYVFIFLSEVRVK